MAYRSTSKVKAKKGKGPINYEVFPQTRQVVSVEELLAAVEIDSQMGIAVIGYGLAGNARERVRCAVATMGFSLKYVVAFDKASHEDARRDLDAMHSSARLVDIELIADVLGDPEVSIIVICSPVEERPNLVRQAMSGGDKITICEGPVGNDPDTVRELFRFVSETGRTLFVPLPGMHSKTFSTIEIAMMASAHEIFVQRSPLGGDCPHCDKLLSGDGVGGSSTPAWLDDCNDLLKATVDSDVLSVNFCLGMRPCSVATTRGEVNDSITLNLKYPSGTQATINLPACGSLVGHEQQMFVLTGEDKSDNHQDGKQYYGDDAAWRPSVPRVNALQKLGSKRGAWGKRINSNSSLSSLASNSSAHSIESTATSTFTIDHRQEFKELLLKLYRHVHAGQPIWKCSRSHMVEQLCFDASVITEAALASLRTGKEQEISYFATTYGPPLSFAEAAQQRWQSDVREGRQSDVTAEDAIALKSMTI